MVDSNEKEKKEETDTESTAQKACSMNLPTNWFARQQNYISRMLLEALRGVINF